MIFLSESILNSIMYYLLSEGLIMKKFLKIAAIISIVLALLVGVTFYFVMSIFKEDKEIASNFVKYSSSGVYEQASELMHDALKNEFPITKFEEVFKTSKPYVDISFTSMEAANSVTLLKGLATTKDGCSSKLDFEILAGKITSFNISPLCTQ